MTVVAPAIESRQLSKRIGKNMLLAPLDLTVPRGAIRSGTTEICSTSYSFRWIAGSNTSPGGVSEGPALSDTCQELSLRKVAETDYNAAREEELNLRQIWPREWTNPDPRDGRFHGLLSGEARPCWEMLAAIR